MPAEHQEEGQRWPRGGMRQGPGKAAALQTAAHPFPKDHGQCQPITFAPLSTQHIAHDLCGVLSPDPHLAGSFVNCIPAHMWPLPKVFPGPYQSHDHKIPKLSYFLHLFTIRLPPLEPKLLKGNTYLEHCFIHTRLDGGGIHRSINKRMAPLISDSLGERIKLAQLGLLFNPGPIIETQWVELHGTTTS